MDSEKIPDESGRGHRLPRTLLVDHAAALLGVSRRTVYNRIHEGRLTTIRTRSGTQRVLLESLEALLRDMRGESMARGRSEAAKLESQPLTLQVQALARDAKRSGGGGDLAAMLVQCDLDHFALDFRERRHAWIRGDPQRGFAGPILSTSVRMAGAVRRKTVNC